MLPLMRSTDSALHSPGAVQLEKENTAEMTCAVLLRCESADTLAKIDAQEISRGEGT